MGFFTLIDGQGCQYTTIADSIEDLLKAIDEKKAKDGWVQGVLNAYVSTNEDDETILEGTSAMIRARRIYRVNERSSSRWKIKM